MEDGAAARVAFALGVGALGLSVLTGAVWQIAITGAPPPLGSLSAGTSALDLPSDDPAAFLAERTALASILARDAQAQVALGFARMQTGDPGGAIEAFEAAAHLHPTPPTAHSQLARLYLRRGDLAVARHHAEIAWAAGAPVPAALRDHARSAAARRRR